MDSVARGMKAVTSARESHRLRQCCVRTTPAHRWARSRDGREVLSCAGIDPNERVVTGLMEFVGKGVRTSVALSREESERRNAAAQQAEAA